MDVLPDEQVRHNLNVFWGFQGATGDIVDGFIDIKKADIGGGGYKYRLSELEPNYAAHKNTVETDHETSLIQAIYKWYTPAGEPMGSGTFRGEAGVLYKANALLRAWAEAQ